MDRKGNNIWCIAYIDSTRLPSIERDIENSDYPYIKPLIPTVKIIRKQFKGKVFFSDIPLLFNYGFIKLPLELAHSKEALLTIKAQVPAIYSWLYKKDNLDKDNHTPRMVVETIKYAEIIRLRNIGLVKSVYSSEDIHNLQPGSYILLKGYPFDNIPAEVLAIYPQREEVKVQILSDYFVKEVTVSFANIFYTIYSDFQEPMTYDNASIESMVARSKFKLDKISFENEPDFD